MAEDKRIIAREAILAMSALPPNEFLDFANTEHAIPAAVWRFDEYHAAAAAAVQEDSRLNKLVYKLVPKKLEESEFWRIYFSQVLFVLDSVKVHGQFPPPAPPPKEEPTLDTKNPNIPPPPPPDSRCVIS